MKKYKKIDTTFFEMPSNRLLDKEEIKELENVGIQTTWISCETCRETGATTDGREFCSMECYCAFNDIDPNAMRFLKNEWVEATAAGTGDAVEYQGMIYKVMSTDFSMERFRKKFRVAYSYILIGKKGEIKLRDLEYPLRKKGFGDETIINKYTNEDDGNEAK